MKGKQLSKAIQNRKSSLKAGPGSLPMLSHLMWHNYLVGKGHSLAPFTDEDTETEKLDKLVRLTWQMG